VAATRDPHDPSNEILEFIIDVFTPATLPMSRLGEYLVHLAALLGHKERVHFIEVGEGSARLVHMVEAPAYPKVRERLAAVRALDGPTDAVRAFESLDHMLRADGARADLTRRDDAAAGQLLHFAGASGHVDEQYGPFQQPGQLQGVPISVGGKTAMVNVNLEDGANVHYCEATRELALQIAPLLFYQPIRVHGTGKYLRDTDGKWEMKTFRISHFETLDSRPLAETVERLRGVTRKTGLEKDIIARLAELREA
jgi:hypothetical protein